MTDSLYVKHNTSLGEGDRKPASETESLGVWGLGGYG